MAVVLTQNTYGKSRVRLTKVTRHADRHELAEWNVDLQLTGDFIPAYTVGDNRQVVATDTMKNTVYALASDNVLTSPDAFAVLLARHFVDRYPQVESASIDVGVQGWQRIDCGGLPHPHAFIGTGPEVRVCQAIAVRPGLTLSAGIEGMLVIKTTDSAFRDFHRDDFRTLPDTDDRIFATEVNARWTYTARGIDFDKAFVSIRQTLLETFARHQSLGVQHTLHAMGEAALAGCPEIDEIMLTMPNRHRLLVNLAPLKRDNPNRIFMATDEPHGLITGTLRRATGQ